MSDNILPEEKLLKLIRGGKKNDPSLNRVTAEPVSDSKSAAKYAGNHAARKFVCPFNINTLLPAVFIAACFYLLMSFIYPLPGLQEVKTFEVTADRVIGFKKEPARDIKPFEFYSENIQNRPLFASPVKQEDSKQPVKAVTTDLLKDMTLLGIVSGENPQAIIEDKLTQKTYYLNKGQFIGELQVTDIKEGKITLDFNGQAVELNL